MTYEKIHHVYMIDPKCKKAVHMETIVEGKTEEQELLEAVGFRECTENEFYKWRTEWMLERTSTLKRSQDDVWETTT